MIGWTTVPLGELCQIELGGTPPRGSPRFWDDGRTTGNVWLSIADLPTTVNAVVSDSKEYLSNAGAARGKIVKAGTLLVSFKLTLGRLAFAGRDLWTNEAIAALSIRDAERISGTYLYWFLTYFDWSKAAEGEEKLKGKTLNKAKLKELPVLLPPIEEQRRIVALLDEAFAAIAIATANAKKNLGNARNLFDSFAEFLFNSNQDGKKDRLLGDVCDLFQGLAINKGSKHLIVPDGLPLLRIKDLRSGSHEMCVARTGFPKNAVVFPNDIIYTRTGQIGMVFRGRSGVIHNNCFKVVPSEEMDSSYLFWWLQRPLFRKKIVELASRAAQPDITHSLFKSIPISVPPIPVQEDFVRRIEVLREFTEQMQGKYIQKITRLDQIKKSLLYVAFSGGVGKARLEALEAA